MRLLKVILKKESFKFNADFLRYRSFMASLVEAENNSEIENIFETHALPQVSSQIKHDSKFSVSLNSYIGGFYGIEYLLSDSINDDSQSGQVFGLSAPIGIEVSFGLNKRGSFSIFGSFLDFGTLLSLRTTPSNSSDISVLPEFSFQNIISPGGYIIYGMRNSPLSFGFGAQLGPNQRKISINEREFSSRAWKLNGFLAVDIPLLNIYLKRR